MKSNKRYSMMALFGAFTIAAFAAFQNFAGVSGEESLVPGPYDATYSDLMNQYWNGNAIFQNLVNMQIQTQPISGAGFVDGMDQGTQVLALNGVWYLFNREYHFAPQPSQCPADFSRLVVRQSSDHGKTWSPEVVIATPNLALGECALGDGFAYWDADTNTIHYLSQVLTTSPNAQWNMNHYSITGSNPMSSFTVDSRNPVVKSGALWNQICAGANKSCPAGTGQEGTPEISFKSQGYFYVTFHGAHIGGSITDPTSGTQYNPVSGYRGMAKTTDFHTWIATGSDLPSDAMWSSKDCQPWSVAWNSRGCIGGGLASSLITSTYTYMLIESSDVSIGCPAGVPQNWVIGLARAPEFQTSGNWQQLPRNPALHGVAGTPCSVQYARLFTDSGNVYMSYWLLGLADGPHFYIDRLTTNSAGFQSIMDWYLND